LQLSNSEVVSNFRTVLFVFFVQIALIVAIKLALSGMVLVVPPSPKVLGVRFICTLLMHL
jgi:hypothetical protein